MKNTFLAIPVILTVAGLACYILANQPAKLLFHVMGDEIQSYSDEEVDLFFHEIQNVDPEDDARKRFRLFDRRFVGVMGIAILTPGIEPGDRPYLETYGYKEILGGTDFIQTKQQEIHNEAIHDYAERYNVELLRILKARGR